MRWDINKWKWCSFISDIWLQGKDMILPPILHTAASVIVPKWETDPSMALLPILQACFDLPVHISSLHLPGLGTIHLPTHFPPLCYMPLPFLPGDTDSWWTWPLFPTLYTLLCDCAVSTDCPTSSIWTGLETCFAETVWWHAGLMHFLQETYVLLLSHRILPLLEPSICQSGGRWAFTQSRDKSP